MTPENHDPASLAAWEPIVSGNAELRLTPVAMGSSSALRLDFDFKGAGGFVVARCALRRSMPGEYAVRFRLRGSGPLNNLEIKLVDDTGLNVWRHVVKDLKLPARWKDFTVESRDIDFAWGPSSGRGITQLGSMEFAIVAGEGGQGTMWLTDVEIDDRTPKYPPQLSASSEMEGFEAAKALTDTGWKPRLDDRKPWIVIDMREPRVLGGLVVDWLKVAPARGFRVSSSSTGRQWKTLHATSRAGGTTSNVYLPALKTRFLRLTLAGPSAGAVLRIQPFDFSRSIPVFWHNIADAQLRGWHPRWLHREQSLWTPIGTSHGRHCALMNEDGMVEPGEGSFSIEPMLRIDGHLITWAEVNSRQELMDLWMPVPTVIWETLDWRLRVRAQMTVTGELRLYYRFENLCPRRLSGRLYLLLRPFQVTPPWQSFRRMGGMSPIKRLAWNGSAVAVDDSMVITPLTETMGFGALGFDDGFIAGCLMAGNLPRDTEVRDPSGFASGALEFDVSTTAQESREHVVHCRLVGTTSPALMPPPLVPSLTEPAFDWGVMLAATQWSGNGWSMNVVRAALTATAHVLVTRAGPALQPGPRRYTRSWIRDGAMMSAALLRMRRRDEVREFIRWYAPYQRADGFVPCCVDSEGVDWLVEHDSHGELIALIADYHRFSADAAFLEETWMFVERAVGCIAGLLGADGLLPISVSHEGYLAQPVHSYWDDFWALRGLRDAVYVARTLGRQDRVQQWELLGQRLAASLYASIEATRAQRNLDFIPGSIEWADFDPTATANAIYLLDVPREINRAALERTFDKYLADWRAKRAGTVPAANYTPYEIRIIGALVRMGRRDDALELLKFFLSDRRPEAWNQWPEISWRDQKAPAHIGDIPHTWIAAEYVLAVRSLFAYEREADETLVLAAGLAREWLEGAGARVDAMPTLYGNLSYTLQKTAAGALRFEIGVGVTAKLVLRPPLPKPLRGVTVNGDPYHGFDADSVTIMHTPAEVVCTCLEE
jgi:F5/8 type C domain-containing protein